MNTKLITLLLILVVTTNSLLSETLRIEPKDLVHQLNKVTILDARENELYKDGHIDGALNFPISLTYEHIQNNGKLTNPIKMQKYLRKLGLTINSNIIVYDDGSFYDATRLFWALEVYGFKNVKLLNIGYKGWKSLSYKTTDTTPVVKASNYIAQVNNKRFATKFTTQIATKNPNHIILDARGDKAYNGNVSSAKRFGHIPKALNFPASHNINYSNDIQKLKPIEQLREVYKDVDKNKKVILYCAIGKVAATNYFALRELNYDVANYDASWNEWGNDNSLPIVNPSKE